MNTTPYWIESASLPPSPALEHNVVVDVAVIGGGVTGITTAYLLKQAGATVALVERQRCAQRDTGHTTAHLTCVTDERLTQLVAAFGRDHAQAVWDAGQAALAQIRRNVAQENIDCEFVQVPTYLYAADDGAEAELEPRRLRKEASLAADLGFDAVYIKTVPLVDRPGIRFPNQAKFHPRKYLRGLLRTIEGQGSRVFEETTVEEIKDNPLRVETEHGSILCRFVVVATNMPLQGKAGLVPAFFLQTKLAPYTSYAIGARLAPGLAPEACWWDTHDPYYYLRIDRHEEHDYAVFGGEDHKTGQARDTQNRYRRLERRLRTIFPLAQVEHCWSGQVIATNDGLPFIGEIAPGQFIATGFCGNGITFGTVAGMMACDLFAGRSSPWRELFDPHRTHLKGGTWNYLKENKDYVYYMLKDRLTRAEGRSVRTVGRGQGKVLRLDGHKVAAFRNSAGELSLCSAVCPHLGCLVDWNEAEQTWDCPCHGSRFEATGARLAGPAESDLAEFKPKEKE